MASAVVVIIDTYLRRVPNETIADRLRRYPTGKSDPDRREAIVVNLYWSAGMECRCYFYDRIDGAICWLGPEGKPAPEPLEGLTLVASRFDPWARYRKMN